VTAVPARARARFRTPVPDDAAAVAAVINARELADRGGAEVTVAMVDALWSEREIELAADGLIAESGGRVVGFALTTQDREFVQVTPDHEGRGIGSELLRWAMARSGARGAVMHRQIIGSHDIGAAALLRDAGYARIRSHHRMDFPWIGPISVEPPDGILIRPIDVARDAKALHRVDAEAFADNADYVPETFVQFCDEHLHAPARDANASVAALAGDRIVGFLLAEQRRDGDVGYVSVLGVSRSWRGRGVGTALLHAAFRIWLAAGVPRVGLMVASDNPGAKRLYERLGMTVEYSVDDYERPM